MAERPEVALITGSTDPEFAWRISQNLAIPHTTRSGYGRKFGGNDRIGHEFVMRMPLRGWDKPVIIIQSTFDSESHEQVCQMTDAVAGSELAYGQGRRSAGSRPIVIIPHAYGARQDKRGEGYSQAGLNHLLELEINGPSLAVFLDFHNPEILKEINMDWYHVDSTELLAQAIDEKSLRNPLFVGPDHSAFPRADKLATYTGFKGQSGYFDKDRDPYVLGKTTLGAFHGPSLKGRKVVLVDDLYGTGGSAGNAGEEALRRGAASYAILTTHGPVVKDETGDAEAIIEKNHAEWIAFSDSLPQPEWVEKHDRIHIIRSGAFWAKVIEEILEGKLNRGTFSHDLPPREEFVLSQQRKFSPSRFIARY